MYAGKYYSVMAGDAIRRRTMLAGGYSRFFQRRAQTHAAFRRIQGDPGIGDFFKKLVKPVAAIAAKVAKPLLRSIPGVGLVMGAADVAGAFIPKAPAATFGEAMRRRAAMGTVGLPEASGGGLAAAQRLLGQAPGALRGLGAALAPAFGGGVRRRYRRMNALNPKAANRAIRRIKAVRKLVRKIEAQLPKKAARPASPFRRKR